MKNHIGLVVMMALLPFVGLVHGRAQNPALRFNRDGQFRIVQFTDIHFQYDSYRSDSSLELMKKVIREEKPDLVVLTGDVVTSKKNDTRLAWLSLAKPMTEAKVPWAVTLGNHDIEYDMTGRQIMKTISGLPYNLTKNGPANITGNGNYILPVKSYRSGRNEALLYFFDSGSGFKPSADAGRYEWIGFDQIQWYREQSRRFTVRNGGKSYPALAFFHIPLPEYREVIGNSKTVGIQQETVCSPDLNTGLYTAMYESGDVMGIFTGHDHDNNFTGCLRKICLSYGNVTGRECYGKIGRGARVIEMYEGERKFDTWILKWYECDGKADIWKPANERERMYFVSYPDSFPQE